jgi:predicted alpha/beta superfamily hydrolase
MGFLLMMTVILEGGFFGIWIALSGALWYNGKAGIGIRHIRYKRINERIKHEKSV